MPFNRTIFRKGLVLVTVPLAFEIGFVMYLLNLLHEVERLLDKEHHSRQVVQQVDNLRRDITQAAFSATAYAYRHDPALWFAYQNHLISVDEDIEKAQKLCAANPKQMAYIDQIVKDHEESIKLLDRIQRSKEPMRDLFPIDSLSGQEHPFVRIREAANNVIANEQIDVDDAVNKQARKRDEIQNVLYSGIGISILFAIAATGFLARNITGRLRFVMDNTRRMIRRERLNPEVGGCDEIAELDRSIHRTATELEELETFKRELSAMVTHELRTPLTSVQGILTLMRVGALGELPSLAKEKVQVAEANTQRLIRLINDLLDIEKMEAGKLEMALEPVAVSSILHESIEAVRDFANQYSVSVESAASDAWVNADAERIVQVVINLVSNAVKYSPNGGTVRVETLALGELTEIRVIDQGRGIPPEYIDRIFDKFQQVDARDAREKKGTGLGLAICKAIIEQHGGTIGAESEPGAGSTFCFTLATAAAPAARTETQPATPNATTT